MLVIPADVHLLWVLEDVLIAVTRDVPHHDLVAFLEGDVVELVVPRRGAAEVHQRRLQPQDLVDSVVHPTVEVLHQVGELIGMLLEQVQCAGHRMAGGVVGTGSEQGEEDTHLVLVQLLTLVLCLGDPAEQIVARILHPLGHQFVGQGGQLHGGVGEHHQRGPDVGVLRVVPAGELLGGVHRVLDLFPVGDAQHAAEDLARNLLGDQLTQVALAAPGDVVDDLLYDAGDPVGHLADVARGECHRDDVAQLGVARRVGHDERQHGLQLREVVDEDALGRAEHLDVAGDLAQMGVLDDRPEALGVLQVGVQRIRRLIPANRFVVAQIRECLMAVRPRLGPELE